MSNELLFSNDARNKIAEGIKIINDAVSITLGPKGRNVIIEQSFGAPLIINDGVTIAKSISLKDKFQNLGASLIIEAATKTNDAAGDGTTTAVILSSNLILEGLKYLDKGINPVIIREGLEHYQKIIIKEIEKRSVAIKNNEDINQVATLSSSSKEIGSLIAKAYLEGGNNSEVRVDESRGLETTLELVKGYSYDRGFASSYMATSNEKNISELENPDILVTDKKINSMKEILPFLENAVNTGNPLLIVCDDIEQEVLNSIVLNKLRGTFNVVVTKAPSFGDRKIELLKDIALISGANFISTTKGDELASSDVSYLGKMKKVIVDANKTILLEGNVNNDELNDYIESLKKRLMMEESSYEKDKLKERIAKLSGGIAVIKVGAPTEVELKEKKLRIEDALCATKAAMISGTIEGAGKVLYEISDILKEEAEYEAAYHILNKVLKMPFEKIVTNSGLKMEDVLPNINHKLWLDARTKTYVNLRKKGIIDPASVEIAAIINAISVAALVLTTECAITNSSEERTPNYE